MNNMDNIVLWKHQKEAVLKSKGHKKCLINIWCGCGKTRIIVYKIFDDCKNMNIIVFPTLELINQFNNDYILKKEWKGHFDNYDCLSFCSDNESKLKINTNKIIYTTDIGIVQDFVSSPRKKIMTITYQSFEKFIGLAMSKKIYIDRLYYDEAHHIVGDAIQQLVFNNDGFTELVDKTEFYTATPVNKNGITMYDRDCPDASDCGPLAFEYLYYQAQAEGVCKGIETQITLYTILDNYENKYQPIFESIIRTCLSCSGKYDYWNILSFHSFVNGDENTESSSVNDFVTPANEALFIRLFSKIQKTEFPETASIMPVYDIVINGIGAETRGRDRILDDFNKKVKGRIYLLASCRTLNEGIDTRWVNMVVPISPSQSIVTESQRIGRLSRKPEDVMEDGILIIPCYIDTDQYASVEDPADRDKMIREQMNENGNFNTVLNVIAAFKYQYDPELFDMCLHYPSMYAPNEIKSNLKKQGYKMKKSKGSLLDNLRYLDCTIADDIKLEPDADIQAEIDNASRVVNRTLEVHTQDIEAPIINAGTGASLKLFYNQETKEYHPIFRNEEKSPDSKNEEVAITPPRPRKKIISTNIHPDLEMLWKIKECSIDMNKNIYQGILDVDVNWNERKWDDTLLNLKKFMDENNKRPSNTSENADEKRLGNWISIQQKNYKSKKQGMKEESRMQQWKDFIEDEKYKQYMLNIEDKWNKTLQQVKSFIDEHNKKPREKSINEDEKRLGLWIGTNQQNYKSKKNCMKEELRRKQWKDFIEKYKQYFIDAEDQWYIKLQLVKSFMDEYNKRPSSSNKNADEKRLAQWITQQQINYKGQKHSMILESLRRQWKDFIEKYKQYFIDTEDQWVSILQQVKSFIDEHNKRPSNTKENAADEKQLGSWISNQQKNYKDQKKSMKEESRRLIWDAFCGDEKYKQYFISIEDQWVTTFQQVTSFIDENNKRPLKRCINVDEKRLGTWIGRQQNNYKIQKYSMQEESRRQQWYDFREKYKQYFIGTKDKWVTTLQQVMSFIDVNNKLPSRDSENKDERLLGSWFTMEQINYKNGSMKDESRRQQWKEFIEKYNQYFIDTEDICNNKWELDFIQVKEFMNVNNRRPISSRKNTYEGRLGFWISYQRGSYKDKTRTMILESRRLIWENFIEEYKQYFIDTKDQWVTILQQLMSFIDVNNTLPSSTSKDKDEKRLYIWFNDQKRNYKNGSMILESRRQQWDAFCGDEKYKQYFIDTKDQWDTILQQLMSFIDVNNALPSSTSKDRDEKRLYIWINAQKRNYKSQKDGMKEESRRLIWENFIEEYKLILEQKAVPKKSVGKAIPKVVRPSAPHVEDEKKEAPTWAVISGLHQRYKTMNSQTLSDHFKKCPGDWAEYHRVAALNDATFTKDDIPRNRIIKYLEALPGSRVKEVVDLGCGKAQIALHFAGNKRFQFHNFDHVAHDSSVTARDIANTGLDDYSVDIAILCLAMWGSNCRDYLSEIYRIIDEGGRLLIVEPYKRWNEQAGDAIINKLELLLLDNKFVVTYKDEDKFMFIECKKM
jgi:superfamily II DNA or RNA helicase